MKSGRNQFAPTVLRFRTVTGPIIGLTIAPNPPEQKAYVESVREYFLALGCGSDKFGAAEAEAARDTHRRGIPLAVIEEAMLMGACRKYNSWFQGRTVEPYPKPALLRPVDRRNPAGTITPRLLGVPSREIKQLGALWGETVKSGAQARKEEDQPPSRRPFNSRECDFE